MEKEPIKGTVPTVSGKLETLSEKATVLRNHFYNHAFNAEVLSKVVEIRDAVSGLIWLAERNDFEGLPDDSQK